MFSYPPLVEAFTMALDIPTVIGELKDFQAATVGLLFSSNLLLLNPCGKFLSGLPFRY